MRAAVLTINTAAWLDVGDYAVKRNQEMNNHVGQVRSKTMCDTTDGSRKPLHLYIVQRRETEHRHFCGGCEKRYTLKSVAVGRLKRSNR